MKILIIGDLHFRYQLPYATALPDARKSEWEEVKTLIQQTSKNCQHTILMGDCFNSKHNHSSVNTEFVEFLNGINGTIHMIAGNHERFGKETALDFIKEMKNPSWHVYTEPTHTTIGGSLTAQFVPYMTPGTVDAANNEEARDNVVAMLKPATYMFHHHIFESTKWEGGDSSIVNELVLPASLANNYTLVFGGHIHQPSQVTENVYVTGNVFTNEVGEHEKYIFILDTDTNTIESIKLPLRGIYKVEITEGKRIPKTIPDKSIVKVTVFDKDLQGEGVEEIRKECARFDSFVLIEQYTKQRKKVNLSESGALDLSIENLLKVYCEQKKVSYEDIKSGFELLES